MQMYLCFEDDVEYAYPVGGSLVKCYRRLGGSYCSDSRKKIDLDEDKSITYIVVTNGYSSYKNVISICRKYIHSKLKAECVLCGGTPDVYTEDLCSVEQFNQLAIRFSGKYINLVTFLGSDIKTQRLYNSIEDLSDLHYPENIELACLFISKCEVVDWSRVRLGSAMLAKLRIGFDWCREFGHNGSVFIQKRSDTLAGIDRHLIKDNSILIELNREDARFVPIPDFRLSEPKYIAVFNGYDTYSEYITTELPTNKEAEYKYIQNLERISGPLCIDKLTKERVDLSDVVMEGYLLKQPVYGFCGPRCTGKTSIINQISGRNFPTSPWGGTCEISRHIMSSGAVLLDIPVDNITKDAIAVDVLYVIWSPEQMPNGVGKSLKEKIEALALKNNCRGLGPYEVIHVINKVDTPTDSEYIVHNKNIPFTLHKFNHNNKIPIIYQYMRTRELSLAYIREHLPYVMKSIRISKQEINYETLYIISTITGWKWDDPLSTGGEEYIVHLLKKGRPVDIPPKDLRRLIERYNISIHPYMLIKRVLTGCPRSLLRSMASFGVDPLYIMSVFGIDLWERLLSDEDGWRMAEKHWFSVPPIFTAAELRAHHKYLKYYELVEKCIRLYNL